jgi:thiamine biosynthesis lipoprotein
MNKRWHLPFLLFLIIGTVIILNQSKPTYRTHQGKIFGTLYTVTYEHNADLQAQIVGAMQAVDNSLSPFNKHSIITHVNHNDTITIDTLFAEVFRNAQVIYEESHGAFDPTVAPLVNAWGFGFKSGIDVTTSTIDSLRSLIGMSRISLIDGHVVKDDQRIMLDFSAIAKGYGSDRVARVLDSCGVQNYMVEIGGEVVVRGHNRNGNPWGIGINKPIDDSLSTNQELQTVLRLTDCAIATSGNYRNFYYKDGVKYAHTIDPRSGYPVQHSLLSATVIADNCMRADALATAFMVLGTDSAMAYCKRHPEIDGYFIVAADSGRYEVLRSFDEEKYR